MTINNFRIIVVDELNLTFEEYKEVRNPINKSTSSKWVQVGGYYSTLNTCLKYLKDYIIRTYMNIDDYNEVLSKIDALNDAMVSVNIKPDARRKGDINVR